MRPIPLHRGIVFVGALVLTATGCGILAPLPPLPAVDAGVDVGAMEANPVVTDGGPEVLTDGPMEAPDGPGDAGEAGTPPDVGKDAAPEVSDAADAGDAGDGGDTSYGGDAGDGGGGHAVDATDAVADVPSDGQIAGDAGDTGTPPDAAPDAGPHVVACDPSMPFGDGVPVYGLNRNPGTEQRVTLSPDELTAYVSAGADWTVADLYVAKRRSRTDPFGKLVPLAELNGPGAEVSVSVTGNGLTLFMNSDRWKDGRIGAATRQSSDAPFGTPSEVPFFGDSAAAWDPYVLPDGSALYFASNVSGNSIYRAALTGTDFADLTAVPLPTGSGLVVVSQDEHTIYFAAYDPTGTSWGDIWMATRTSTEVPFSGAMNLSELNTPGVDYPEWISPDGCRLYFARTSSLGGVYSYVAERGGGATGGDAGDAGTHPDAGSDAGPPVVACDRSKPFAEPVLVYGLNRNLGTDQKISLSPDELTAYVSSGSFMGLTHLSVANRASRLDPFGPLVPLHQLDGPGDEIQGSVTADGLMLFFGNDWTGIGRIAVATRQLTSEPFGSPGTVEIQGKRDQFSPYVLPDGSALYFSSNEDGPVAAYRAVLQGTTLGPPTLVWARANDVQHPVVSADELSLYYQTLGATAGDYGDIWVTTRASRDVPFGAPAIVSGVNTSSIEFPQWISPDGCRLYLGRSTSDKENYLFVAERVRN